MKEASVTENREKYIGGSDIPAIFGISPFKTRWQLILEKAEPLGEGYVEPFTTPAIEYGNRMEPVIRDFINKENHTNFQPSVKIMENLRGNCDGLEEDYILEIKTTTQMHDDVDEYKAYLLQLLFYMELWGKSRGMLAVYERPEDYSEELDPERLHVYYVDRCRYDDLIDEIKFQIERFVADVERVKENPLLTEEDLQPKELVNIVRTALEIESQLEAYKRLEDEYKSVKTRLKKAMQDAGIKRWIMNNGTKVTLVEDGEDKVELKLNESKLKEEEPDVWNKYAEEKVKKGRAGYVLITPVKE